MKNTHIHILNIAGHAIQSEKSVLLLGVEIDYKLNFAKHIGTLCKRAVGQIYAMSRIGYCIGENEKRVFTESFIYSNFNYCLSVWMICSNELIRKIERIQERTIRILHDDY